MPSLLKVQLDLLENPLAIVRRDFTLPRFWVPVDELTIEDREAYPVLRKKEHLAWDPREIAIHFYQYKSTRYLTNRHFPIVNITRSC